MQDYTDDSDNHTSCSPSCTARNSTLTVSEEPDGQHLKQ